MSAPQQPSPGYDSSTPHQPLAATSRPWQEFLSFSSFSLPVSLSDATARLSRNLTYYRVNYAAVSLVVLLLSLIYHPIAIIVFLATLAAWFFLFFSRSVPLDVLGREIDDRVVLLGLTLLTVVALVFASVWLNVFVSALISGALICSHGVFRVPSSGDDPYGGLLSSVVDDPSGVYNEF